MLDFRVKRPKSAVNWRYQEIVVTAGYLTATVDDPNLVELDSRYEMGIKGLDVFLNGQRLTEGVKPEEGMGFIEVDDMHIRLSIGLDDDEQPYTLEVDDVIIIKEWFNSDSILYSYHGLDSRLTKIQAEVETARGGFVKLDDRLNDMGKDIASLLGEGDYEIEYTYAPNNIDIIKERVTGDYDIVKEYTYLDDGRIDTETIYMDNVKTSRAFQYWSETRRVRKVISSSVNI